MNSIIYDDNIITPEKYIWEYYYDFFNKLNKKDCVKFSLFCAKTVNNKSNLCIELVEKWLLDEKSVKSQELFNAAAAFANSSAFAYYAAANAYYVISNAASAAYYSATATASAYSAVNVVYYAISNVDIINKYLQIFLRKTKQFGNNKVLEQISKVDVDQLELVDWNMITDIMQEEYNIGHEFNYDNIFSRRCLIELLRKEYI